MATAVRAQRCHDDGDRYGRGIVADALEAELRADPAARRLDAPTARRLVDMFVGTGHLGDTGAADMGRYDPGDMSSAVGRAARRASSKVAARLRDVRGNDAVWTHQGRDFVPVDVDDGPAVVIAPEDAARGVSHLGRSESLVFYHDATTDQGMVSVLARDVATRKLFRISYSVAAAPESVVVRMASATRVPRPSRWV